MNVSNDPNNSALNYVKNKINKTCTCINYKKIGTHQCKIKQAYRVHSIRAQHELREMLNFSMLIFY